MELKTVKEDKNMLQVEVVGEGTTFVNLLKEALLEDKSVVSAASIVDHPLLSNPPLFIRTKGKKPKTALKDAVKLVKKQIDGFESGFKKAK